MECSVDHVMPTTTAPRPFVMPSSDYLASSLTLCAGVCKKILGRYLPCSTVFSREHKLFTALLWLFGPFAWHKNNTVWLKMSVLLFRKEPGLGGAFFFSPSMATLSLVVVGSHFLADLTKDCPSSVDKLLSWFQGCQDMSCRERRSGTIFFLDKRLLTTLLLMRVMWFLSWPGA